ncbi:hypothetical protein [Wenyingzhuangia aestuarii]|uniref:hypothetical protein n=1 Tax=Wenyingzhuangia aestuarii TaxID=1647582 RepID=UPI00143C226D|nr:hypothetical protein [Wenyingzhuangia aestuarii]NJB83638.1 hypothetical protein [Wenyingzhuangia aestuarii]
MKKIKKRIKRALAAFLREELMEYIGYNHRIPYMSLNDRFKVDNLKFETVVMEQDISIDIDNRELQRDPLRLERQIEDCKRQFADEVLKHIHVDTQNLTNRERYMRRSVRFVLRVQAIK